MRDSSCFHIDCVCVRASCHDRLQAWARGLRRSGDSAGDADRLLQTLGGSRRRLPWMVFDYIDGAAGASERRSGRQRSPRFSCSPGSSRGEHRNLRVTVFGEEAGLPFSVSPMGMCNLSRPGTDLMLARMAARERIPIGVSTLASTSLETMMEVSEGHAWFQLYFGGDMATSDRLLGLAARLGTEHLLLQWILPRSAVAAGATPRLHDAFQDWSLSVC